MKNLALITHDRPPARGFTLIEAVISILLVSVMLVAALNTVGASRLSQMKTTDQSRGQLLAEDLMAEILDQPYEDPINPSQFGQLGRENESGGIRTDWNDVDDYDGWSGSPPQDKTGNVIPGFNGWSRQVSVQWANSSNLIQTSSFPTGIKRIEVQVKQGDLVVASLTAIRTFAWP